MQITSATDMALVGVASPAAKVVELHETTQDGNVIRMRAVDKLALPAAKTVDLTKRAGGSRSKSKRRSALSLRPR